MIYDVLLLMLCTFFKGLSVAKIQNFLLKRKEIDNYVLFKRKVYSFFIPILYF